MTAAARRACLGLMRAAYGDGLRAIGACINHQFPQPFALSLSKGFDRLSPNGLLPMRRVGMD
jgi:hypothetical protein